MTQMTLMGISDMFYIISITCAFQKAKPSAIVLFTYSIIVFAFIADVVVFKMPISLGQLIPALSITVITISLGVYRAINAMKEMKSD